MILSTFRCDVCGALKKESNHWWAAWRNWSTNTFYVQPFESALHGQLNIACGENEFHLCGQSCVNSKLSEFMDAGATRAEKREEI